jgi:hypothetical protein
VPTNVAEVRSWPTMLLESFRAPGVNDVRCESKLRSRAPCQSNKMHILFLDPVDVYNYRYIIIGGAMLLFIESSRQPFVHNFSRDDRHKPPRWTVYICNGCGSLPRRGLVSRGLELSRRLNYAWLRCCSHKLFSQKRDDTWKRYCYHIDWTYEYLASGNEMRSCLLPKYGYKYEGAGDHSCKFVGHQCDSESYMGTQSLCGWNMFY